MSPARLHRERLAFAPAPDPSKIVTGEQGGQPAAPAPLAPMTPAREHRLAIAIATPHEAASGLAFGVDPIVGQMMLRLQHDLRRLKEIKAIDRKIAAKREMLPEYRAWCDGLLSAGQAAEGDELPSAGADEVLPTMMVWSIDVGDWDRALELAELVLRFRLPMPARYERDAATLVLEEIAEAALKVQARSERFPLDVLERVEALTADVDMHDQPRAKLLKAIGFALNAEADRTESGPLGATFLSMRALEAMRRAQQLNDRVGVKTEIRRLEKALGAPVATEQAGSQPAA